MLLPFSQHLIFLFPFYFLGVYSATFTLVNKCTYPIWPATLSNSGTPSLPSSGTGFSLPAGAAFSLSVPTSWSGRVWARTQCSTSPSGVFSCATADCGSGSVQCSGSGAEPPATLAEFTLSGSGGLDFYDVSLVDGYNLPVLVRAVGGSGNCSSAGCVEDLNDSCPPELRVVVDGGGGGGDDGIACKSACDAFGKPQYCCSGAYSTPDTCGPSQYSKLFKKACPSAYSYAYDDASSIFTCNNADYVITFCPTTSATDKPSEDSSPNTSPLPPTHSWGGSASLKSFPIVGVLLHIGLSSLLLINDWEFIAYFLF